jgi:signal transduction histidine kinase
MTRMLRRRLSLTIIFSSIVFTIFMITAMIVGAISFFIIRAGLVQRFERNGMIIPVLVLMLASIIVGTVVAMIISRIPLNPVRKVIEAINQLAKGDFSARLQIARPPEFRELADSFNRMAQELGSIEMLRVDFINNFSHEFKTPIVSIKGFAEMLRHDDLTAAERNEYLGIIISESDRLASLATHVLDLSKIENQAILTESTSFNLAEQVRRCILVLETQWEKKGISFSVDIEDVSFTGNEELMSQVWINLLDNAIKFSPQQGSIDVSLKLAAHQVIAVIRDNGCGIGEEAARHVFDKFYQADPSLAGGGYGLGLALARKIVELHKGTITCTSQAGAGTSFVVVLPAA